MSKRYRLGIDIGGTGTRAAVVDESYNIISLATAETRAHRPPAEALADIALTAKDALRLAGVGFSEVQSVGVGVPGAIDHRSGRVVYADNLGWRDLDVAAELESYFHIKPIIANDADCALLAEARAGAARAYSDCVMLTLGTGVGGAILIGGALYAGGDGFGCEPGHMTVVADGLECACGRRGCLECYCSATALIRDARKAAARRPDSLILELAGGDILNIDGRTPFDAARAGDEAAREVVERYIHYLAVGISSYIAAIRPQAFIIGGGVSRAGDELFEPLRERVRSMVYSPETLGIADILPAELGGEAGALGAAAFG